MLAAAPPAEASETSLDIEFDRLCNKKFKSTCPLLFKPWRLYRGRWVLKRVRTKGNRDMFADMQSTGKVHAEVWCWKKGSTLDVVWMSLGRGIPVDQDTSCVSWRPRNCFSAVVTCTEEGLEIANERADG